MSNNVTPFTAPVTIDAARQHQTEKIPGTIVDLFHTPRSAGSNTPRDTELQSGLALTAADVWRAICDERVRVHYQPQYQLSSGEMVAAEALVRLIDNDGQLIYPDRFIELAERSDLIAQLGRAVIDQVCADLATCRREGFALQRVAINLAAHQLNVDAELPDYVGHTIAHHGLQPEDLEFELTERQGLTENCQGMAVLRNLADQGARIVIDDFGMGYSSVAYLTLHGLPVSAIKLDRALVSRLPHDKTMQCVTRSVLTLAADLGLEVVAEGVETNEQNEYLASVGCSHAQGFGYAMPMSFFDLQEFMADSSARNHGYLYG
jgi:EAL domain-containing protein (putative c-di-GMP-specific phosphodiesterase class I)